VIRVSFHFDFFLSYSSWHLIFLLPLSRHYYFRRCSYNYFIRVGVDASFISSSRDYFSSESYVVFLLEVCADIDIISFLRRWFHWWWWCHFPFFISFISAGISLCGRHYCLRYCRRFSDASHFDYFFFLIFAFFFILFRFRCLFFFSIRCFSRLRWYRFLHYCHASSCREIFHGTYFFSPPFLLMMSLFSSSGFRWLILLSSFICHWCVVWLFSAYFVFIFFDYTFIAYFSMPAADYFADARLFLYDASRMLMPGLSFIIFSFQLIFSIIFFISSLSLHDAYFLFFSFHFSL